MIRPVEFQGVVQRNQDMASVNQNENDKPFINHENVVAQIEKQTETKIRDVNEKDNADNQMQKTREATNISGTEEKRKNISAILQEL